MREWKTVLQVTRNSAFLLVTSDGEDLLKARLNASPSHPRALLTLLEGLALWRGEALDVVVSAGVSSEDWAMPALFGDELFPAESQLVRYHIVHPARRARRLRGVADFRPLRRSGT
jgi:hypothetical protein